MDEYNNNNNINIYPTPQLMPGTEKKKKRRLAGLFKFTAAALAFGVIAGAAASGYHYLTDQRSSIAPENKPGEEYDIITEESDKTESEPVLIPTGAQADGIISDVSDVVDKVMPSIVAINSTGTITDYDIFFGRQYNTPVEGSGSGIIIGQSDESILIVTNNHVVSDADKIEIIFADDSKEAAVVKGADARADLAVLEVAIEDLSKETLNAIKVARLGDSKQLKQGEMVIAIGNALGYGQSVTVGYISALNREVNIDGAAMNLLQTDAAINPGNSGGALLNTAGEVIGINSVKYANTQVEGMGYAIPISDAIPMINILMNREILEESEIGFLGIDLGTAQEVTEVFSEQFDMPVGIYINNVVEDSPAEKAGLRSGSIITGFNEIRIETIEDLANVLSYSKAGEEILLKISVLENGKYVEKELKVVLGERP